MVAEAAAKAMAQIRLPIMGGPPCHQSQHCHAPDEAID